MNLKKNILAICILSFIASAILRILPLLLVDMSRGINIYAAILSWVCILISGYSLGTYIRLRKDD